MPEPEESLPDGDEALPDVEHAAHAVLLAVLRAMYGERRLTPSVLCLPRDPSASRSFADDSVVYRALAAATGTTPPAPIDPRRLAAAFGRLRDRPAAGLCLRRKKDRPGDYWCVEEVGPAADSMAPSADAYAGPPRNPAELDALVRRAHAKAPEGPQVSADSVAAAAREMLAALPPGRWSIEPRGAHGERLFITFHPQMHPLNIVALTDAAVQWPQVKPVIEWAPTFARALVEMHARAEDAELRIGKWLDGCFGGSVAYKAGIDALARRDSVPLMRAADLHRELRAAKTKAEPLDRYHAAWRAHRDARRAWDAANVMPHPPEWEAIRAAFTDADRALRDAREALLTVPDEATP